MTIKQLGGVFGRNPTFNDVTIEGTLTFDGGIDITSDLTVDGTVTADGLTVNGASTININDSTTYSSTSRANGFLQINNTNTTSGVFSGIELIATGAGSAGAAEIICIDRGDGSGDLAFSTRSGGTWGEKVRILAGGSVGIGEVSPATALHLKSADPVIRLEDSNPDGVYAQIDGAGGSLILSADQGDGSANSNIVFKSDNIERARIDSSGNVGINTTPKAWTAFNPVLQIKNASTGGGGALAGTSADNFRMFANTYYDGAYKKLAAGFATQYAQESGTHVWSYAATGAADSTFTWSEAMRLDSSGNFLVGTTATPNTLLGASATQGLAFNGSSGYLVAAASGQATAYFNRQTSDGTIADFRKDGASVGSIGVASSNLYFGTADAGIFANSTSDTIQPFNTTTGTVRDALIDLGSSGARFKDLYRSGSTISTSDRNMKQDERSLTEAETRVAQACKGLLKAFRFIDAVEVDGDNARIHFGIIAQDLQVAFEAEGLDATKYAMFRPSTYTDDEGNEQTRLGVCYENLLAFIIAAI